MQYTPNYELPLYEPSDIANYLETYNNTITEIDNAIHEVQLKAEYGGTQGAEMQKEIESLNSRVTELESSLNTTIENVTTMSSIVSGHTEEIAKLKEDLLAQNTVVKSLSNTLTELSTQLSTFKTAQESFNDEISAKVGNRYFKAHKYEIPALDSHSPDSEYSTQFTINTGLENSEIFTKSHLMLEFMQINNYTKKSSAVLNFDFSTTSQLLNISVDNASYYVGVTFDSTTGIITIKIRSYKLENSGTLYANATVYTD
jgi:archaellum component FlaC